MSYRRFSAVLHLKGSKRPLTGDAPPQAIKSHKKGNACYFAAKQHVMQVQALCFLFLPGMALQAQQFTQLSNSPLSNTPGDSRSVNFIDVNGDGLEDVYISNGLQGGQNNELYLNLGKNVFEAVQNDPIVQDFSPSDGATFADTDNDGDFDGFMVTWYGQPNFFYRNDGTGTFTRLSDAVTGSTGTHSETAAFGDFNGDGFVDVFITNSGGTSLHNFLYLNKGNNSFVKLGGPYLDDNLPSRSANWADFDNDGDLDIYVTNESDNANTFLRNSGNGSFSKITSDPTVAESQGSITASWGDVNNDGWLDLFVGNTGDFLPQPNRLFINNGNGGFTPAPEGPINTDGGCTFGSAFADYDNDGDLDLFVANGFCTGLTVNYLYKNDGTGVFERDQTSLPNYVTPCSYGTAWGDLNNDGFPDLVVATCKKSSSAPQPDNFVFINNGNDNHWLNIKLQGTVSNRAAIGAQVSVTATINGQTVKQLREISAQSGYCGQNSLIAHFGLGYATDVHVIKIRWPSGLEEVFGNMAADQTILIQENQSSALTTPLTNKTLNLTVAPNPIPDTLNWSLQTTQSIRFGCFELTDAQGKVCFRKPVQQLSPGTYDFQYLTEQLAPGVYILRLISDAGASEAVKVVK